MLRLVWVAHVNDVMVNRGERGVNVNISEIPIFISKSIPMFCWTLVK